MALTDLVPKQDTPSGSRPNATAAIARARTLEAAIATIRTTARSLIGCEGISVVRRVGDLCHYVEEDAIGPLWKGQKFPIAACLSGWSMINGQTAVVPDIFNDERIPFELYAGTFVRALAMAPIGREDPIGAIGAYWSRPYRPGQWEIDVLEALAEAVSTAVSHINFASVPMTRKRDAFDVGSDDVDKDMEAVANISAVPTILDVAVRMTGMRFAAIARVTDTRWITCSSLDHVGFGLKPGDELSLESTLCNEIRNHRRAIAFDDAAEDPQYCDHHTPRIYGLRSYISMPIILANGSFWGTLCAIDSRPAKVNNPQILGSFKLFAELIAHHLDAGERLQATQALLERERELSELREQFIAVLGHDLRNPLAALDAGTTRLQRDGWNERSPLVLQLMKSSISRMGGLVDNVLDLARARLGGGIGLAVSLCDLRPTLVHVVDELRVTNPEREIVAQFDLPKRVAVDRLRIAQMLSNLLSNAVSHGDAAMPVTLSARSLEGLLTITVTNGGEAIEPELLDKLFLPFKRGDNRSGVRGLGLGLYIASQIAQAHGGRIDVRSEPDKTCFTFTMAVAA
jgi:signal transduction histidine kinase